jgi:hypothetical protein
MPFSAQPLFSAPPFFSLAHKPSVFLIAEGGKPETDSDSSAAQECDSVQKAAISGARDQTNNSCPALLGASAPEQQSVTADSEPRLPQLLERPIENLKFFLNNARRYIQIWNATHP